MFAVDRDDGGAGAARRRDQQFAGQDQRFLVRQQQALASYRQTVLLSLEEVENALVALSQEKDRRESLQRSVAANTDAVSLSTELYTRGLGTFLDVLDAQRSLMPIPKGPVPTSMKGMRGNLRGR